MIYPLPIEATMRDDVVEESLSQSEALANAPQIHLGMFRVPRIIEEE
jgi:aspartyl/glutamyl-tRNA(Asn/Gln) amidotransferase C subunit